MSIREPNKGNNRVLMKYLGLATQIMVGLALAVFAGLKLDKWLHFSTPLLVWILPLLVLVAMIWQVQKIADVDDVPGKAVAAEQKVNDNSYEGLQQNIPTTQEKLDVSNQRIMNALFSSGQTFMNKLEEYADAILVFEDLLRRFPNSQYKEEALFNLVYAYEKTGDKAKAEQYKKQLTGTSPDNKFAKLLSNPASGKNSSQAGPATKKYEEIYKLFIEGNFDEAKNQKKAADNTYGKSYWTPQLLFIESIYYIRQKEDSTAIRVLTDLSNLYNGDPMAARAKTMIDVLKRRKEIESYLTKLEVTRNDNGTSPASNLPAPAKTEVKKVTPPATVVRDSAVVKKDPTIPPAIKKDTAVIPAPPSAIKKDTAVISTPPPAINKDTAVIPAPPPAIKKDTAVIPVPPPAIKKDTAVIPAPPPAIKKDTAVTPIVVVKNFSFVPGDPQYVVVLLDKVDPVYANEARNAFNRFNQEKYYNQKIEIAGLKLNEQFNMVLQGPFADANAALDYIEKVRPVAKSRILPWLTTDKYSFLVISNANLDILKDNKDMDAYKLLIQKAIPGKF